MANQDDSNTDTGREPNENIARPDNDSVQNDQNKPDTRKRITDKNK